MARGTQHLRKRPRPQQQAGGHKPPERRRTHSDEAGMFFPKLRWHARWMFVLLALVFAGSFVFLGVGSGSSGLGDILGGWLNTSSGGGPSISKLEKKTEAEPRNAKALRELVTAYETDQRNDDAIRALERYTELRPKDTDALQELTGLYQRALSDLGQQAQLIQLATPASATTTFQPPATTPFGRVFADPTGLQDPIAQALSAEVSSRMGELQQKAAVIQQKLLDANKKVVELDPNDPTAQFQLGQIADSTGDTLAAVAAYKRFLELSPDDPLAAQVKDRLKQLSPPPSSGSG